MRNWMALVACRHCSSVEPGLISSCSEPARRGSFRDATLIFFLSCEEFGFVSRLTDLK
jgi:hypothetical protein